MAAARAFTHGCSPLAMNGQGHTVSAAVASQPGVGEMILITAVGLNQGSCLVNAVVCPQLFPAIIPIIHICENYVGDLRWNPKIARPKLISMTVDGSGIETRLYSNEKFASVNPVLPLSV